MREIELRGPASGITNPGTQDGSVGASIRLHPPRIRRVVEKWDAIIAEWAVREEAAAMLEAIGRKLGG